MLASLFLPALAAFLVTAAPSYEGEEQTQPVYVSNNGTSTRFVASAWFPGWSIETFPISSVSWSKYSLVTYSFAYASFVYCWFNMLC
jgi:hypothetical protein